MVLDALSSARALAFIHVTVIDGSGGAPRARTTVVVRGRHVLVVGPDSTVLIPADAWVIDARRKYLIPGLWDMHVHVAKAGSNSLALFVANGVTSVRDMGGDFAMIKALRDSVSAGQLVGPRIKTPGPMLEEATNVARMLSDATVEPVARFRVPVATVADAQRVVDALARLGVDCVKIRTVISREVYLAIGKAVRRRGLTLVGHMVSTPDDILTAHQRSVEHVILTQLAALPPAARKRALSAFVDAGIVMVPTLVVGEKSLFIPDRLAAALVEDCVGRLDPRRRYVSGYLVADWREQFVERTQSPPVPWASIAPALFSLQREIRAAGLRVAAGNRCGDRACVSRFQSARGARADGAAPRDDPRREDCKRNTISRGVLRHAGFAGDDRGRKTRRFVLLDADPLSDIRNTTKISGVVVNGRYFDRRALDALLKTAEGGCANPSDKRSRRSHK